MPLQYSNPGALITTVSGIQSFRIAVHVNSIIAAPCRYVPQHDKLDGGGRAVLEAVDFRVRRIPVGFCLRFFVFL